MRDDEIVPIGSEESAQVAGSDPARTQSAELGWGIWHVPLYGPAGFVVPLVLAFYYTWLYNKTRSVLLCILLHASFTPAQDHLLLTADSTLVDAVLLSTYLVGAGVLIALTRGRLGYGDTKSAPDSGEDESSTPYSAEAH